MNHLNMYPINITLFLEIRIKSGYMFRLAR